MEKIDFLREQRPRNVFTANGQGLGGKQQKAVEECSLESSTFRSFSRMVKKICKQEKGGFMLLGMLCRMISRCTRFEYILDYNRETEACSKSSVEFEVLKAGEEEFPFPKMWK